MKLNICHNDKNHINNYINIDIVENKIDLSNIVNNSCEEIIVADSLDYISYDNIQNTIFDITQKIRLNGKLIIVGTDLRSICRLASSDNITIEQFNEIISNIKSINTEINIRNILISLGLTIDSNLINHHKYEIIATRR